MAGVNVMKVKDKTIYVHCAMLAMEHDMDYNRDMINAKDNEFLNKLRKQYDKTGKVTQEQMDEFYRIYEKYHKTWKFKHTYSHRILNIRK